MGINLNPQLPFLSALDAPIVANTIVESSILGPGAVCTFPADSLGIGTNVGLGLFGQFSNRLNAPGTITLQAKLGGNIVWSSGALALQAALHTNVTFMLDLLLLVLTAGANTTVRGGGVLILPFATNLLPPTTPVASAPFNSAGVALDLDLTAKFSVADPGNSIQMLGYQVIC